ncbi:TIR-like protein FxsC [Catenulispora subtropica]|uniref:TIR domain-containing protein n=1 Tax=Catenulispora subtropica TaxID=450798 RepID=A0ABN2RZJ1_9ACTN
MTFSGRAPAGAGDGSSPYFFLSYARHHHAGEAQDTEDPDRWTLRFFEDLTFEVTELTTLPRGAQPGFMDRDVRVGQRWRQRISEALAACRVFVPLYTPRYFTSLSCASEWYLFQARQSAHELTSGARPEAIIPVLWLPIPDTELPAAAQALQFDHHTLGEAYARLGFLQLIRLARYQDEYQLAIHALARHVVQVAHDGAPQAARPVDFTTLHGRFETADGLFEAAGELVRRAGGRPSLPLPGPRPPSLGGAEQLALPPGTGELWKPTSTTGPRAEKNAETHDKTVVSGGSESGSAEPATGAPSVASGEPGPARPIDGEALPAAVDPSAVGPAGAPADPLIPATAVPSVDPAPAGDAGSTDRPIAGRPESNAGRSAGAGAAETAVAAYLRAADAKLAEWFTSRPAQVSSFDFDEFYFREVHPAAKAALLRQLTPQAPAGPFPRPPRLRGDPDVEPPSGGPSHAP